LLVALRPLAIVVVAFSSSLLAAIFHCILPFLVLGLNFFISFALRMTASA
jgi:hypothetical protein